MEENEWPTVHPHDDGIRPAGRPDECLYCRQKVGSPHGRECVIVKKRVEMKVIVSLHDGKAFTGLWQLDEPHSWDSSTSDFHKNESSWCANNFMNERATGAVTWDGEAPWDQLAALAEEGDCLCSALRFEFVRVVDPTPKRDVTAQLS